MSYEDIQSTRYLFDLKDFLTYPEKFDGIVDYLKKGKTTPKLEEFENRIKDLKSLEIWYTKVIGSPPLPHKYAPFHSERKNKNDQRSEVCKLFTLNLSNGKEIDISPNFFNDIRKRVISDKISTCFFEIK